MKIYEFRLILPTNVDQYKIGNIYMTAMRSNEESKQVKGEGIETIKNEEFSNEKESGFYTYKIMHFKSRLPGFLRWALPDKYCHCHEKSWNAYPHYHTEYSVPGMGDDLVMSVESQHRPYKAGEEIPDNLLELSKDELKIRKIVYLDILDSKPKPAKDRDIQGWVCPELGVNEPLNNGNKKKYNADESKPPAWTKNFHGDMMVAVKVVKLKFHWRGLQSMVEKFAMDPFYHNLFLDAHRAMMRWGDKWGNMTLDEVRSFDKNLADAINAQDFERDDDKDSSEGIMEKPADVQLDSTDSSVEKSVEKKDKKEKHHQKKGKERKEK